MRYLYLHVPHSFDKMHHYLLPSSVVRYGDIRVRSSSLISDLANLISSRWCEPFAMLIPRDCAVPDMFLRKFVSFVSLHTVLYSSSLGSYLIHTLGCWLPVLALGGHVLSVYTYHFFITILGLIVVNWCLFRRFYKGGTASGPVEMSVCLCTHSSLVHHKYDTPALPYQATSFCYFSMYYFWPQNYIYL